MKILPYNYKKVANNLRVRVSNHFFYSDFGVRDGGEVRHYGRRYICEETPGTGFIERESESHSYHEFVRKHMSVQRHNYWDLLMEREPDYDRELQRANNLMHTTDDQRKRQLMECYANALTVGRLEEQIQRTIRGVKDKMGHHHNKYMVSIISHYKHKISQLERDMVSVEYHVKDHCSAETYAAYEAMTESFSKMVARCRRVWHHNDKVEGHFAQVFFDMGIFDFIRNENFLPLMRDSLGTRYYLLPDILIAARSSVDFDIIPLKTLTVVCQETAIEETTELLSSRIGDAACMMLIPELNLTFYFNHARVVVDFVHSLEELKKTL
ncbi:MAG: hypothetical protein IK058_04925 [Bacteroidales bacterium]|nr:hypothetical protein [Bacteroidales bacterium]